MYAFQQARIYEEKFVNFNTKNSWNVSKSLKATFKIFEFYIKKLSRTKINLLIK